MKDSYFNFIDNVKVNKYYKKDIDGGILKEKYEIDRFRIENLEDEIENLLLGSYNEYGNYVIAEEIIDELVACKKVIIDKYENILFLESYNEVDKFGQLRFAVKVVDGVKQGTKKVILELLEPIFKASGFIENTQSTIVKEVVIKYDDDFENNVKIVFNIAYKKEDAGNAKIRDLTEEFKEILNKKITQLYLKKILKQNQTKDFECVQKNKKVLEKSEVGKKILKEYEQNKKIMEDKLKVSPENAKSQSDLLNNTISKYSDKLPKEDKKEIDTNIANSKKEKMKEVEKALKEDAESSIQKISNDTNKKVVIEETKKLVHETNKESPEVKQGVPDNFFGMGYSTNLKRGQDVKAGKSAKTLSNEQTL